MFTTILFVTISLLIVLVALAGGLYFFIYWWLIQRPVPKYDGNVDLPCLDDTVQVIRDKHAIPHIYAQSEADLFRAQGYIHAQDRLWQMEQSRRTGQGRLAEIFGEVALEADRFSRIVGFQRAAEAEETCLDESTHQVLEWYAQGVNAYIESRSGKLAAEFNLLRVQPEPWRPVDTLVIGKVIGWGLSINWESELTRLRLVERFGPIRAAELDPEYSGKSPIILEGMGSQEVTRMLYTAGLLLNQYEEVKQWLGIAAEGQGSNSWAIAPEHSLNGRTLLCNDPHLALQMPGIWYENHLQCPGFEVSGVSFTGSPAAIIGHNEHIAWGITNGMPDVQDLFFERAHPEDAERFEFQGEWEEAQVLEEIIKVRRQDAPHIERVVITRHGPLISGLLDDNADKPEMPTVPLALQWVGHQPGQTMRSILNLNRAHNWEEFDAALSDWSVPPQNITYADAEGNIGYILAGDIPIREKNLGLVPAPGWTGEHEWLGNIPHAELPHLHNPESGIVITANNKIVGDEYPYFLGVEFMPGWRAGRIEEILSEKERFTIRDMEQIQLDTGSRYARELAPWITLLYSDDPWEKAALNALRTWNYRMDTDSEAALVFHYTLNCLLEMTFGDKLGPIKEGYFGIGLNPLFVLSGFATRAEVKLVQLLAEHEESIWYTEAATGRTRTREQLLQEALTQSVRKIRETVGDSTRKWDWGRSHQIRYVHPLGSVRILRGFFNRGPYPIGGDGSTPNQTRHAPRLPLGLVQITPSYRQIFEIGAWDRAQTITTSGQSGHPLSDHYDDQITMFREGIYRRMPWSADAVNEGAVYRTTLKPVSQPNDQ